MTDPYTGMPAARFGLYLHFPYCLAKCPYCDFAVAVAREVPEERYTRAVLVELDGRLAQAPWLRERLLGSVFLGGGTPSLWHPRWVAQVLSGIAARLRMAPDIEVTLEANPELFGAERYRAYREAGITRLSLGAQSFDADVLRALGRAHGPREVKAAYASAREAGFASVSLDFIYGVQGQTLRQADADARQAAALAPDHLSAYVLTLEREVLAEEVPLARRLARGELTLPSDDEVVAMGAAIRDAYGEAGLARYEISNHARPGHASRHNALYWTGGEYLALGVGAVGMLLASEDPRRGVRYVNARRPESYLAQVEQGALPEASREALGPGELFRERLAMGLRLTSGVEWEALCTYYGEAVEARRAEIARWVAHGLAVLDGGRLRLTEAGLNVHSGLSARLI